jgi:Domain of unknown function (DUF4287)
MLDESISYQAYIDSIRAKTGKSPDDFRALAEKNGVLQTGVKDGAAFEEDFGHGHAMAVYGTMKSENTLRVTARSTRSRRCSGGRRPRVVSS